MKKISVNIVTNREGGIDAQLRYFAQQTFKNFEIVIVDNLWDKRHEEIENLIKTIGLDVVYMKQRRHLDKIVDAVHAMVRNEALTYADAEYILFFDDYQIPTSNLIEEHVKHLNTKTAVIGKQIMLNSMDMNNPDYSNVKSEDKRYKNNNIKNCSGGQFCTNNASAPLNRILEINGFDMRYNGGTGGEDNSMGLSLNRIGLKFICNPNALCYHIDHGGVPQAPKSIISGHGHNLSAFVKNPYHDGDPNLMENEQFKCWRDKWSIKRYRCKWCGVEGVCDSMEIHKVKQNESPISPLELFDLKTARANFKKA